MFLLRCVFFLSIVYSSMSWTNGAGLAHGPDMRDVGHAVTAGVVDRTMAGVSDLCARHAAECLAEAARLTSLFAAAEPKAAPADRDARVPRPVPDPRRHGRDAKLARAD